MFVNNSKSHKGLVSVHCTLQDSDTTAELHATTVVALLEHLGLQDVTLVMHDWGGKAVLRSPDCLRSGQVPPYAGCRWQHYHQL